MNKNRFLYWFNERACWLVIAAVSCVAFAALCNRGTGPVPNDSDNVPTLHPLHASQNDQYILVVYTDPDFCRACKEQAKTLEEIRKLPIRVYEFGLGEDRATKKFFKFKMMPTYLLWHKKKGELWRNHSAKETKKKLEELLDTEAKGD